MKRTLSGLVLLVLTATLATQVYADSVCTVATLTGNYGWFSPFEFVNHNMKSGGPYVPSADMGTFNADGAGHWSAAFTDVTNGKITRGNKGKGRYTVNSDCTGSLWLGKSRAFDLVIVSEGGEVFFINTTPGATFEIDAKKQ
jgi:hypothetical protein